MNEIKTRGTVKNKVAPDIYDDDFQPQNMPNSQYNMVAEATYRVDENSPYVF